MNIVSVFLIVSLLHPRLRYIAVLKFQISPPNPGEEIDRSGRYVAYPLKTVSKSRYAIVQAKDIYVI